jgi:hypothetical protein
MKFTSSCIVLCTKRVDLYSVRSAVARIAYILADRAVYRDRSLSSGFTPKRTPGAGRTVFSCITGLYPSFLIANSVLQFSHFIYKSAYTSIFADNVRISVTIDSDESMMRLLHFGHWICLRLCLTVKASLPVFFWLTIFFVKHTSSVPHSGQNHFTGLLGYPFLIFVSWHIRYSKSTMFNTSLTTQNLF